MGSRDPGPSWVPRGLALSEMERFTPVTTNSQLFPGTQRNLDVEKTADPGHPEMSRPWSLNGHIFLHVILYIYIYSYNIYIYYVLMSLCMLLLVVTGCEGLCGPGKSTDRTCLQFCLQFIKIMMFCGLSPAIFSSLVSSSGWVSGWCICAGSAPRTSRLPICRAWIGKPTPWTCWRK